jgi:hypothetical protein
MFDTEHKIYLGHKKPTKTDGGFRLINFRGLFLLKRDLLSNDELPFTSLLMQQQFFCKQFHYVRVLEWYGLGLQQRDNQHV